MRSINLNEWLLTILNETIRSDAEFQINQRNAWQEFSNKTEIFDGVDISAGFQHQQSLFVNELTFEFDLIPIEPKFWDKILFIFHRERDRNFYRLKKIGEQHIVVVHVKLLIKRGTDNKYQSDIILEPRDSKRPENIHVVDITR
jgi:hypothetical protein